MTVRPEVMKVAEEVMKRRKKLFRMLAEEHKYLTRDLSDKND